MRKEERFETKSLQYSKYNTQNIINITWRHNDTKHIFSIQLTRHSICFILLLSWQNKMLMKCCCRGNFLCYFFYVWKALMNYSYFLSFYILFIRNQTNISNRFLVILFIFWFEHLLPNSKLESFCILNDLCWFKTYFLHWMNI